MSQMTTMRDQAGVLEWLRSGAAWPQTVSTIETHAAVVFLVGERAYKLKKAVDLGYLDFSTADRRRQVLERELILNRRTAPDLYLRVIPVSWSEERGFNLDGKGAPGDWLLEMRRFPDDAVLSRIAERNELNEDLIDRFAVHIAQFHDQAPIFEQYDWRAALARIASENEADLRSQGDVFGSGGVDMAVRADKRALGVDAAALQSEGDDVRHCHGDLHLGNAYLDGAQPRLFDCIEFDDFYALIPPLYDLAFLLMDLEARALQRLANRALNSWFIHRHPRCWKKIARSLAALPLYLSLRAEIKAKTLGRTPGAAQNARSYLQLATKLGLRRPPMLVAIGGLSGTGKSSLAQAIAWRVGSRPGALHLRSDHIRKRLADVGLTEPLPPSAYTPEAAKQVYDEMLALAGSACAAGHAVVVDAVFAREDERDAVRAAAEQHGAAFHGFWLNAPADLLAERLASRRNDASDADVGVLRQQLTYDVGHIAWRHIDAAPPIEEVARAVSRCLGVA